MCEGLSTAEELELKKIDNEGQKMGEILRLPQTPSGRWDIMGGSKTNIGLYKTIQRLAKQSKLEDGIERGVWIK